MNYIYNRELYSISESLNRLSTINVLNLLENQRSNFLLNNQIQISDRISTELSENNEYLSDIENQLGLIFEYLNKNDNKEKYQNFAKDLIYKIKKEDEEIDKVIDDKILAFYKRSELFLRIQSANLTSELFTEFSDKEYFDNIMSTIWKKIENVDNEEFKKLLSLLKELCLFINISTEFFDRFKNYKKIINIPNDFKSVQDPKLPEILNSEYFIYNIKNEIKNWNSSTFKEYCTSIDGISEFFESLAVQKREYTMKKALYDFSKCVEINIELQKEYEDYRKKQKNMAKKTTEFLKIHPLFALEWPESIFGMLFNDSIYDFQTVDYNFLLENNLKDVKSNFDTFYNNGKSLIERAYLDLRKEKKDKKTAIITILVSIPIMVIMFLSLYRYNEIKKQKQELQIQNQLKEKIENIKYIFNLNKNGPSLEDMLELESETHNDQIQFYIGERYKDVERFSDSYNWIMLSADQNNADGLARLGWFYLEGIIVASDYEKAFQLIQESVSLGSSYGENLLGYMYEVGIGVQKNISEAIKWYEASAEKGNCYGQNNLARLYHNGIGLKKNDNIAVKWLISASDQGLAVAQFNLGVSYLNGWGVSQSDYFANVYFRRAAEQSFADGEYNIGVMMYLGLISCGEENPVKWMERAAKHGDAESIKFMEHPFINSVFFENKLRSEWINTPYN